MASEEIEIAQAFEEGRIAGGFGPAERVETHLSRVFLAGNRAVKLKRRLKLPFADFTSLEARKRTLETELAINRRTAPSLYLAVQPLTREGAGYALGGAGPAIDYALVMRRFAAADLFDAMAREGRLSVELIEDTARRIAAFHASLAPQAGAPDAALYYAGIIAELEATEAHGAKRLGIARSSAGFFARLREALHGVAEPARERAAAGHVRRGHGDLHLRNICLIEGVPTLFDALEFDEALATTDTLYDLAFLLMDLEARGLRQHANAALNAYWNASGEEERALSLIAFFMALRAAVRMAVSVEAGKCDEADVYLALGEQLLRPVAPRLVAVGGLSGTGKSRLAQALAPLLEGPCGARLLRSDVVRKRRAGSIETAALPAEAYTSTARRDVYRALREKAAAALAGISVVIDATCKESEARALVESAAANVPFMGLWLTAPESVRLERVAGRRGDASDATRAVAARQSEPDHLGERWIRLDATPSPQTVLEAAKRSLGIE